MKGEMFLYSKRDWERKLCWKFGVERTSEGVFRSWKCFETH